MLVFIGQYSFAQNTTYHWDQNLFNPRHPIYKIESRLLSGDKNALLEIAPYFDSKKELKEYLSYNHPVSATESDVARRIIDVCCLFTDDEIRINDSTTSKFFLNFLNANWEKITYSEYATAFLLGSLESRPIKVMFKAIPKNKILELNQEKKAIINSLGNKKIKTLITQKDPVVLLIIASELYKERCWLNCLPNDTNVEKYVKLLQILTNFEVAVEGGYSDYKKMTWHIEKEFYTKAALNLLCYFSANYSKYKWNKEKKIFENKEMQIFPIGKEDSLFQLLSSKNKKKALDAYIQLTTCNPTRVIELANDYEYSDIDVCVGLPMFPFRRLKQLVLLTEYCNYNNIDFIGSTNLKSVIEKLESALSFSERRKLEDSIINNLKLEEITAFEYLVLIHDTWRTTYSAGRILDIFYSKNWEKLLEDEKQLNCYLKKSALFTRLGIIGSCNNYLKKFIDSPKNILNQLENIQTSDEDIKKQIERVISGTNMVTSNKKVETISREGNADCVVTNLEERLNKIIKNTKKSGKRDDDISKLLSQISYEQIPIALNAIKNCPFESNWKKYSFMHRDWGLFTYSEFDKKNNFNQRSVRKDFLKLYSKLSEFELYSYYLTNAGIDYKSNNNLDFDKIYELIKYDIVVAFVGGGGVEDNEVYSLIKLLELSFNTTLGFPRKFCNSNNTYGCSSKNRAKAWMKYLIDNNLLKKQHNEPYSFCYE